MILYGSFVYRLGYLVLIQKREVRVPPRVTKEKQKFLCKTNVRLPTLRHWKLRTSDRRPHAEVVSDVDEESSPRKDCKYNKGATVGQPVMVVAG